MKRTGAAAPKEECGDSYLVTQADSQLPKQHRMRTVGSEEHLQLDGLVDVETGGAESGLTLYWGQRGKEG